MWSCYFFFSCHLSPYLHKSCLISWQNFFMKHFKFVSWQSGGGALRNSRRGFAPRPHRGCAHDPRATLRLYSLPRSAHHHMPAIIKVTQAANFNVLIGWNSIRTSRRMRSYKLAQSSQHLAEGDRDWKLSRTVTTLGLRPRAIIPALDNFVVR